MKTQFEALTRWPCFCWCRESTGRGGFEGDVSGFGFGNTLRILSFTFPSFSPAGDEPRFPSGACAPWPLPSLFLEPPAAASERSRMLPLVARSGDGAFSRNSRLLRLPPSGPVAFSSEVTSSFLGPVLDDADGDGGEALLSRCSAAGPPPSGLGRLPALLRRLFMCAASNPEPSPPSI